MTATRMCAWWHGYGFNYRACYNRATHEWKSNAGSEWHPRCDEHAVTPLVEGAFCRQVRRLVP